MNQLIVSADISAKSAILIDADGMRILYGKNYDAVMPMASTTKIMTAMIALSKCKPDDVVTVSSFAASQEGSSMYLKAGEKISMRSLLYGLMLPSGNDAAVAIAEHISGTSSEFAKLMTAHAKEIGCKNTSFKNPNGLDADGHYTTAYDLALMTKKAILNPEFVNIVSQSQYTTTEGRYLHNHNKLLNMYPGCIGVKTGYTKSCGRTLVSAVKKNNMTLIAVTLNAPDDWNDHIKMYDTVFSKYKYCTVKHKGELYGQIQVKNGDKKTINAVYGSDFSVPLSDSEKERLEIQSICSDSIDAPVKIGQNIGESVICLDGTVLAKIPIVTNDQSLLPTRKSLFSVFKSVFVEWLLTVRQNKMII